MPRIANSWNPHQRDPTRWASSTYTGPFDGVPYRSDWNGLICEVCGAHRGAHAAELEYCPTSRFNDMSRLGPTNAPLTRLWKVVAKPLPG
jgi:hypothetical protein